MPFDDFIDPLEKSNNSMKIDNAKTSEH